MNNFWKRLLFVVVLAALIFALLPMTVIDILGKFAIGWMLADIANNVIDGVK